MQSEKCTTHNGKSKAAELFGVPLVFVLSSGLFAAPKTPLPKRIVLEKHKRGYTVYTVADLLDLATDLSRKFAVGHGGS